MAGEIKSERWARSFRNGGRHRAEPAVIHYQHPSSVEDYFQEFGRAGRDGQPSVAVLLHADFGATKVDTDIGLLQFMAKRASSGAQLDAANQTAALAHKYRQINDMAGLVRQEGCFRQTLIGYFEGSEKGSRRSFSTRLLEWVFAEPATPEKEIVCCDACCRDVIKRWGEIGYVSKAFGLRLGLPDHEAGHRQSETGHRQSAIGIAAFMGGAAILAILAIDLPRGKSTDAAKPQAVANSPVHADRTAAVASLPGTNKSNTPPGDIMMAQNRLIELGSLAGPSDGVWGTKSRMALRAFKIANALAADDKWDKAPLCASLNTCVISCKRVATGERLGPSRVLNCRHSCRTRGVSSGLAQRPEPEKCNVSD